MTTPGYIYALVNASMPGLVKVGRTSRDPKDRAAELSGATGVATPFLVVYHEHFADSEFAENWVHESLQHQGYRVSANREFFNAEIVDVIKTIAACEGKSIPGSKGLTDETNSASHAGQLSPADELFEQAENFYYGCGNELQDYAEAMRLYKQAARLGSSDACIRIGDIYRYGQLNKDKSTIRSLSYYINNENKSIEYYKKAVSKGNYFGYVGMSLAFASLKETENTKKVIAHAYAAS